MKNICRWIVGSVLVSAAVGPGVRAAAEDFRVENEVFVGSQKQPALKSTTIFHQGVVYDFLSKPNEVVILDLAAGRLVLLDLALRVRTELNLSQIVTFTEQLREWARSQDDPFLKILADPEFEEQYDESSGELTLSSQWVTYRLLLVDAEKQEIAEQYRSFCDWTTRLNAMLSPGGRPPFSRLMVNEALARHEAVAREVRVTITPKKTFPPTRTTLRSEHQLVRQVMPGDVDRVAQARQFMQIFRPVGFDEFRQSAHE
jgi:hypothetical protein